MLPLALLILAVPAQSPPASPRPRTSPADLKAIATLIEKGQLRAAEQALREVLAEGGDPANRNLNSSTRDLAFKLANADLAQGQPAEAARLLRFIAEHFRSVKALMQLAHLQSRQKDAAGALESLRKAREIAPNSEEVLSSFAQVSLATRAPVPAILALQPLTRMCPTVAQHHYLLGVAFLQAGDMPAAAVSLEHAEHLEPNRVLTLIALGLAQNGRKLYSEARPILFHALELEPDNVEALAALAEAEEGLGELEQAEAHAQRALDRIRTHATANRVMGMVRMKQERYEEARDALEKAIAADPSSPKAHYQLSLAYARLGDAARSQEHLERYRQVQKEAEERLIRLRSQTGLSAAATRP